MEILYRKGSFVIIKDKHGRMWETKRKKQRRNCRRQKGSNGSSRVIYIPIKRIYEAFLI